MRKVMLTLAMALLLAGSAALTAAAQKLARGCRHRRGRAEFHADRTGGLPGMGALLPAGIYPGLRAVSLLVSALLVTARVRRGASAGAPAGPGHA